MQFYFHAPLRYYPSGYTPLKDITKHYTPSGDDTNSYTPSEGLSERLLSRDIDSGRSQHQICYLMLIMYSPCHLKDNLHFFSFCSP